jgi:hypothetical protein
MLEIGQFVGFMLRRVDRRSRVARNSEHRGAPTFPERTGFARRATEKASAVPGRDWSPCQTREVVKRSSQNPIAFPPPG